MLLVDQLDKRIAGYRRVGLVTALRTIGFTSKELAAPPAPLVFSLGIPAVEVTITQPTNNDKRVSLKAPLSQRFTLITDIPPILIHSTASGFFAIHDIECPHYCRLLPVTSPLDPPVIYT
jgi:hypothetical protein